MNVFLIALGALVFTVFYGLLERLRDQHERKRTAQQWDERERLLDQRKLSAPQQEILQRRSRRG